MAVSVDAAKRKIRVHLKGNPELETPLGPLRVGRGIGEGANALVFRAQWGRGHVAAKFLAEDCSGGLPNASRRYKRFVDEFRELVQLSPSGAVVSMMYQFGLMETDDGAFPYVLMELCPQTLKTWRADNPVGSFNDLLPVLSRLMGCLEMIHGRNIVHRDLKPANVLLNGRGQLVLADFGIAWFDPDHYERLASTSKGERLANWGFSAPEQWRRNPPQPDTTMDIYALGLLRVTDRARIDRLLNNVAELSGPRKAYGLWWNQGTSNLQVGEVRKLDDAIWLIGRNERRVEEAWVHIGPGYGSRKALSAQYVLLNCAPMPSFGLSKPSPEREEAAWFRDRYVSRAEYDDGAAEIDDEVVVLEGEAELRTRNKVRDFLFLGTSGHSVCCAGEGAKNDRIVRGVYEDLLRHGEVKPELLSPLDDLDPHPSTGR